MTLRIPENIRELVYRSPVYDWWLGKKVPSNVKTPGSNAALSRSAAWYADLQHPRKDLHETATAPNFRWLAPDEMESEPLAKRLNDWIDAQDAWDSVTWRGDIVSERVVRWITAYESLSDQLSVEQRNNWARSILRAARHLDHAALPPAVSWRNFFVHQARIFAALALSEMSSRLPRYLAQFGEEVDRQILADGGHIEQSPARALFVVAVLIEIRDALLGRHIQPPEGLFSAIDRMIPYLKLNLHGDGAFALFGGTTANTHALISDVIAASGSKARAMTSAPHTGCHRLRAGQTSIVFFCGNSRLETTDVPAPGSFELSVGKTRIIGNCGASLNERKGEAAWKEALASTAAYTTLVVQERNTAPVSEAVVDRREHEGARLIEAAHDGYFRDFGIQHRRSIYVDAGGSDIRGEDVLLGSRSAPFCIRFHLYPDIRASLISGGGEIILKPPRGRGWRFVTRDPVRLEESVSFHDGQHHRAQQIVILGNHEPSETIVKWRMVSEA